MDQPGAIIVRFGTPQPGREQQANDALRGSLEYFERLQQQGAVEATLCYIGLTEPGGTVILRGDVNQLNRLAETTDHRRWLLGCQLVYTNFTATVAVGGVNGDAEHALSEVAQVLQDIEAGRMEWAGQGARR